jgi:phage terminase large subunit-like protein
VLSGAIPACKWTKAAVRRHLDDLEKYETGGEYYFDAEAVERVCSFVEALPQIKGEWARDRKTLMLELWQVFMLAAVFGWKRRVDGSRRFRIAYVECARKNGKSTLLAAIALYLFAADGESGAEVYSLATTRDQAAIVFGTAKQMALREPDFREAFAVDVNAHALWIEETASKMHSLSSDASLLDGLNIHGAIIDELHAHSTREVWDVVETATGSRIQPLIWTITTAGTNRAGICYEQRSYVTRLLNSTLHKHDGLGYRIEGDAVDDNSYFGIIYTIDDDDDWTDETAWRKANPNYGVSVKPDDMQRLCHKALQVASAQPNFLTKRLDVWVNADSAWMDMRAWERATDRTMTMEELARAGWTLTIGLDLANKRDITGLVAVFRKGREFRVFGKYYLPEDAIDDSRHAQIRGWAEVGCLTECPGAEMDYSQVEADLKMWVHDYGAREIVFDPGFGWDFCKRMETDGLAMIELRPTVMNYSEPMKELDAAVAGGRLKHDGNPVMTWMISNVVAHHDNKGNIYPRKERDENKIDGPIAMIAAMNRSLSRDDSTPYFQTHGFASL